MKVKLFSLLLFAHAINAMDTSTKDSKPTFENIFPQELIGKIWAQSALLQCHNATNLQELYQAQRFICVALKYQTKCKDLVEELKKLYSEKEFELAFKDFKPTYPYSEDPNTPLLMQVIGHCSDPNPQLVKMLLKHGANANELYRLKYMSHKITPIILAIQEYHELKVGWIIVNDRATPQPKSYAHPQDDINYEKKQKRLNIIRALVPVSDLAMKDSSSEFNVLEYAIIENLPLDILQTMLDLFPDDNFLKTFECISSLDLLRYLTDDKPVKYPFYKKASFSVALAACKKNIEELNMYDIKLLFDSN